MKFSLIICTYLRPVPLLQLLKSVRVQSLRPDEIIIVDGSKDHETAKAFEQNDLFIGEFKNSIHYFLVDSQHRGLCKQRNFAISKLSVDSEIVCFLDDDTVLEADYFKELLDSFAVDSSIVGVGGVDINSNTWKPLKPNKSYNPKRYYVLDGYVYKEGLRNVLRNYMGLQSNLAAGKMPEFSHGRSCSFPLNNKTYEVDLLIGMSMAFRKRVLDEIGFSTYFEGYGLYEDADFSIRALAFGKNVVNTKAQLSHFHHPNGRPNQYQYGKMVVRNGWYVWRVKNPNPNWEARLKWNAITVLLLLIRFGNVISTEERKAAFTEAVGRAVGCCTLLWNKPKLL